MFNEFFKKQSVEQTPEERMDQLRAEIDVLSAAALNPGSGNINYNEDAVVALKKAQAELEDLERQNKK